MRQFIIAHDLGTTGNKATLFDNAGCLLSRAFHPYTVEYAHAGWAEQSPEDWWQSVCKSTQRLLFESATPPSEVACLTFSGQMMGCVAVDRFARPLRNAMIWADNRAIAQTDWIAQHMDSSALYRLTGHRLSSSYSLAKILWVRDNQPELFRGTHKFLQAKDFIIARLTGEFVTDPSDASGTNLYDLERGTWSADILEMAQLDEAHLPAIHASTTVVGAVLPAVSAEVGVPAGTPVVLGGGDGACAAVGAGVITQGSAYNYLGSSAWLSLATPQPILDPAQRIFTFAHLVPGLFAPMGTMQAAGASYQWARNQLGAGEVQRAAKQGINPYELLDHQASLSPAGANGLIFLPYLLGERSPRWNPSARGAFLGISTRHTRSDLLRAVLEGVAYNLRIILDILTAQDASITAIRVIGGGARGRFWNQILADIYKLPVQKLLVSEEATSMGAAVAGGIGVGLYPGWEIAMQMNEISETLVPDDSYSKMYERRTELFNKIYEALEPLSKQLAEA